VADFNGDHALDIATGTTGSVIPVLLGNGDGTFKKAIRNSVGVNPHYVAVGDFNKDGKVDVVATLENTTTGQSKVILALGNGDGTLKEPITVPSLPNPLATAVADFNLDGFQDIAIGVPKNPLDGVYLSLGQANTTFLHGGSYATGSFVPIAAAVGDLNGDGVPDLVVLDGSSAIEVLLSTPRRTVNFHNQAFSQACAVCSPFSRRAAHRASSGLINQFTLPLTRDSPRSDRRPAA
jgi:hypothetical protein